MSPSAECHACHKIIYAKDKGSLVEQVERHSVNSYIPDADTLRKMGLNTSWELIGHHLCVEFDIFNDSGKKINIWECASGRVIQVKLPRQFDGD